MKLGFNEANDRFCKNHSVMMDHRAVREVRLRLH